MGRTGEAPLASYRAIQSCLVTGRARVVYASLRVTDPASRTTMSALHVARVDTGESRVLRRRRWA